MAATEAFGVTVKADFRDFEKALVRAQNQTDTKLSAMERRFTTANSNVRRQTGGLASAARSGLADLTSTISGAGAGLPGLGAGMGGLGIAGAAAAVGVGALVMSLRGIAEAGKFAADLTDAADRIGVTVEGLQQLRYAADETGVPLSALDSSLEALNGTLGAFKTNIGAGRIKPIFEALGITQADLADVHNANDLLPILAAKLSQISDRATQVQLARKLGIEALLPILRQGAGGLERMSQEARDLGLVLSGDVVSGLDETDRALERNKQQIDANVRSMQANLAPFFLWVTNGFASLTRSVGDFVNSLGRAENRNARVLAAQSENLQRMVTGAFQRPGGTNGRLSAVQQGWVRELAAVNAQIAANARNSIAATGPSAADRATEAGLPPALPTAGGGGGSGAGRSVRPTRDNSAADAANRVRRFDDQLATAARETLQAQSQLATTVQQRASLAIMMLDAERQDRAVQLERQVIDGEMTATMRDQIIAAEQGVWLAREANIAAMVDNGALQIARDQLLRALQQDAQAQEAARQTYEAARDGFRNDFVTGMRAALDGELGGFFESLADRFTDRMLGNLADDLFALLDRKGGGNMFAGLGSVLSAFAGGVKLPGFKDGGTFSAGGAGALP